MLRKQLVTLGVLVASTAAADENNTTAFTVQRFAPAPGLGDFFSVEDTHFLHTLEISLGFSSNFAQNPLLIQTLDGSEELAIIQQQLGMNALVAIGLSSWAEFGLDLPFTAFQQGVDASEFGLSPLLSAGIGDMKAGLKLKLYSGSHFSFAALPALRAPTGIRESFLAEGFSFEPKLLASYEHHHTKFTANLGYTTRKPEKFGLLAIGDEVTASLGGAIPLNRRERPLLLVGEVSGAVPIDGGELPIELRVGLRAKPSESWIFSFGVGRGLTDGVGNPDIRGFLNITWVDRSETDDDNDSIPLRADKCPGEAEDKDAFHDDDGCPELDNDKDNIFDVYDMCPYEVGIKALRGCQPQDRDNDGILNSEDECPDLREDKDGFEDKDGCPEVDNDNDGIPDDKDSCRDRAEDLDRFQDEDGCPDLDDDGDWIADAADLCPSVAEDADDFEDEDGCPDLDNDQDGTPDTKDRCPMLAEDKDGNEDSDGCPDFDDDKDGIPEKYDLCPTEQETYNGQLDDDGCPDSKALATLEEKQIALLEPIVFTEDNELDPSALPTIKAVAAILKARPEITHLRIEAHTNPKGKRPALLKLSQARANLVMKALVAEGIGQNLLSAKGYGGDRPLADASKGNQRIAFVLMTPEELEKEKTAKPKPTKGKKKPR